MEPTEPRPRTVITGGRVAGGTFALDDARHGADTLWGEDENVLWSAGESLMIFGPQGTVKTTLMQRLALHRVGLLGGPLLGFPVRIEAGFKPFLYLAMDRPRQAARSIRRMVREDQRELLNERLIAWKGPLPFNVAAEPDRLATWAAEFGVGGIAVDSLKDLAPGLSKDEVGAAINIAFQSCTAGGIEVLMAHHPRKGNSDDREPSNLDGVYGSTWLTAGCGSVICIWGEAGDRILRMKHLKQPLEPVGPFRIAVDHVHGQVSRTTADDALGLLREAGVEGLTAEDLAVAVRGGTKDADLRWAQRQLADLVKRGLASRWSGTREAGHGQHPDRFTDAKVGVNGASTRGVKYLDLIKTT
jgi:replicative DNA helicase